MSSRLRMATLLVLLSMMVIAATSCTRPAPTVPHVPQSPGSQALTVYSGRAEGLVQPVIEHFSESTGIDVRVRYAGTAELAATIMEEGRNSPADVFFAQDPGGIGAVEALLTRLPESILALVEPEFVSPEHKWVGVSGRARVIAYNTRHVKESELPDDVFDLTDPKWRGRIGWAPTNASLQAMVTAMRHVWGEEKTRHWLEGMQANSPKVYANNTAQIAALGTGEVDVALPNHYYLYRFLEDEGESFRVRNYHPRAGGPGAVMLVAGAGILDTSDNKGSAEKFLEFMLSPTAQEYFATRTYEYPVIQGVVTHRLLTPLAEISSPEISMADMADLRGTLNLLREVGIVP